MKNKNELIFKERARDHIRDKFSEGNNDSLKGKVKIFEHKIGDSDKKLYLLWETNNLIVYRGRSWLAQRAFNKNIDEVGTTYDLNNDGRFDMADVTYLFNQIADGNTDITLHPTWDINGDGVIDVSDVTALANILADTSALKDLFVAWMAIGTGGCVSGHPLTPSAPDLRDTTLSTHGVIDSGMRYVTVGGNQYHQFDEGYPTFEEDEEISTVGLASENDKKLVVKTVTTLTEDEANDDDGIVDPDAYQEINEAGLFASNRNTISPVPDTMEMFARVTFPTIKKNNQVELVFNWYIFF